MAMRAAASRAMSAVAAGKRVNIFLKPHAELTDYIEKYGDIPETSIVVDGLRYAAHPLHTLVIGRTESRGKNQLYEAVKAYLLHAAGTDKPNRITGVEHSLELDGMKLLSNFSLSSKEREFAWHEVQSGFTHGGTDESLHNVCSSLNPALWEQISGCSSYQTLIIPCETETDAHLKNAYRKEMEQTFADILAADPMFKPCLRNTSVAFDELYAVGVESLDPLGVEPVREDEFMWRIHDGHTKIELSFLVHKWDGVLNAYLPYILQNFSNA